ncbi:T9SS type A sorting domain-containing protein [Pedobacter sp. SD-b]|uniref:T9SS type A sorting domain-containing protein n=1 Tax=Pedobacter segetis TaxID=2793069 RepID=A0ABS1BLB0_9SPHI|nr:T9SS type A sorting domain-containing protein [Pedobacter segetis]MBK0383562.1 T9SS type A sorting domain-containing protein [Pedobacter segetis]
MSALDHPELYPVKVKRTGIDLPAIRDVSNCASRICGTIYRNFWFYPNPFSNSFTISFNLPQQADVTASLADMSGRQVYTEQWEQVSSGPQRRNINVSVKPGSYVLTLVYGKQTKSTVLIKQ